jgi:serine/threonine protein phosphatase 1
MNRTWAIGDVHGCERALTALLNELAPSTDDTLVFLGDVVDRGPSTRGVIEKLISLAKSCRTVCVLGNHEEMLLTALRHGIDLHRWIVSGGQAALDSYGGDPEQVPEEHLEFLESFVPYWFDERAIYVHANLQPGLPLDQQTDAWLRWSRLTGREPRYSDAHVVVVGHTPQPNGLPLVFDGWAGIDTLAYGSKWLTALEPATGRMLQANEEGETRTGLAWS